MSGEIVQQLKQIVEPSALRMLGEWLEPRTCALSPDTPVVLPESAAQLAEVVAASTKNRWRLVPCGHSSKLDWGRIPEKIDLLISTSRLNRLIDHAAGDLTVTAEAGLGFQALQAILAQQGQFLALDPAYPEHATLGGILATADAGSLRHRYGSVRDLCLGVTFVRYDGEIVKAGGRVVKNVAGYDLMKLFTGSFGTLGIVTEMTFRLYPVPKASRTILIVGRSALPLFGSVKTSALTPSAVDLLSASTVRQLGFGNEPALAVRFWNIPESVQVQSEELLAFAGTAKTMQLYDAAETQFQDQLRGHFWSSQKSGIVAKVGVLPTELPALLPEVEALGATGWFHSSGIGLVRWEDTSVETIGKLRKFLETRQGFLTVLEAPATLKAQLDVWGYPGNALKLMKTLQRQFDPQTLLSPGRFI
ncbi:MAG: FAD-binding oxidoreductase [Anaerolineae bacterium]|nr:FAD-binding oxidoreductase [Gloeobacterales cyanobacterium ES-bin-313]